MTRMAEKTAAPKVPSQPQSAEERVAAQEAQLAVKQARVNAIKEALADKPLAQKDVADAEQRLCDAEAVVKLKRADVANKRRALSTLKQLLGEPVRVKRGAVDPLPAGVPWGPQSEASGAKEAADGHSAAD
jgi:hypothetical protein